MSAPAAKSPYAGHRFPAEIISHAVWLYFRFPLSLRHVDEILAARGVVISHETVRQWGLKFGQAFANQIRRRLPRAGDKWHLDEVAVKIWSPTSWRATEQQRGRSCPASNTDSTKALTTGRKTRISRHDDENGRSLEHPLKDTLLRPATEATKDRVPASELPVQITPGAAGAGDPEHRFEKAPVVGTAPTAIPGLSRQQRRNPLPLHVVQHRPTQGWPPFSGLESAFPPTEKSYVIQMSTRPSLTVSRHVPIYWAWWTDL